MSKTQASLLLCIIGLLAVPEIRRLTAPRPTPPQHQAFEYLIEAVPDVGFDRDMARLGNDGWELLFARRASGYDDKMSYECIFKRPKLPPPASNIASVTK